MPVAAIGDPTTGHGCFPSTNLCKGSQTIVVEGRSPSRLGDDAIPHKCGSTHGLVVAKGSSTVIYDGVPVARIGDPMSCGDVIAAGRQTIIIGG